MLRIPYERRQRKIWPVGWTCTNPELREVRLIHERLYVRRARVHAFNCANEPFELVMPR